MDANHQTATKLWPHNDVTLNIGLGKGSAHTTQGVPHRLRTITKLLPLVLAPGYHAELRLVPRSTWTGEPMMVVQGTFLDDVDYKDTLWRGVVEAEQDCIALYYHGPKRGFLFGPNCEAWGEFNINFFSFLGDNHE